MILHANLPECVPARWIYSLGGTIGAQGELRQAGTAGQQLLHGGALNGLFLGDQLLQACNQRIGIG